MLAWAQISSPPRTTPSSPTRNEDGHPGRRVLRARARDGPAPGQGVPLPRRAHRRRPGAGHRHGQIASSRPRRWSAKRSTSAPASARCRASRSPSPRRPSTRPRTGWASATRRWTPGTFALHHLAHAHNALTSPDHLAGQDAKSMAQFAKWSPAPGPREPWVHGHPPGPARARPPVAMRASGSTPTCRAGCPRGTGRGLRAPRAMGEEASPRRRWAVVSWPREYGGREASPRVADLRGEYYRAARSGGPERHLPPGADPLRIRHAGAARPHPAPHGRRGGPWPSQSEPTGSDLAGIKSVAVRDTAAGGFRLSGQKTWCTPRLLCSHLFGLFRTDPAAERHHGMTYFLVSCAPPGSPSLRRLTASGGRRGLLDDVLVPDLRRPRRRPAKAGTSLWPPPDPERGLTQPRPLHGHRGPPRRPLPGSAAPPPIR